MLLLLFSVVVGVQRPDLVLGMVFEDDSNMRGGTSDDDNDDDSVIGDGNVKALVDIANMSSSTTPTHDDNNVVLIMADGIEDMLAFLTKTDDVDQAIILNE